MAHQVAETFSETSTAWSPWSTWNAPEINPPDVKGWPPDPPPINGYYCRKCHRKFDEPREVANHETSCFDFAPLESFLQYERGNPSEKSYDTSNKMVVSSQPLTTSDNKLSSQSQEPPSEHSNPTIIQDKLVTGMIKCEFCDRECKGRRGLKLHQKKCVGKSSNGEQSSQQSTDATPMTMPMQPIGDISHPHDIAHVISVAYEEVVSWRKNMFDLPRGHTGKQFVANMNKLVISWINKSVKREYAMKALMIMPALLLQRTSVKTKSSVNKETLKRRLQLWESNQFEELLQESRTLQGRLPKGHSKMSDEELIKRFTNLMLMGNVKQAVRLLEKDASNGVLPLNEQTLNELRSKHPEGQPMHDEMVLEGPMNKVNSVIFDEITSDTIKKAAVKTKGSAGPSLYDADDWRTILGSNTYGAEAEDLRKSLAHMAKDLCINEVDDPESLEALLACRLIPLDKNPGLRPIGIGETLRRILGKAVMSVLKKDVQVGVGNLQLCGGHVGGCEVGVHAVVDMFNDADTEGVIQIDASNAFNSINRKILLHNAKVICPQIATYIYNSYCTPARLFIVGGEEIKSSEGTTQGDPIAMSAYGIGLTPLLDILSRGEVDETWKQVAFADDISGVGKLLFLRVWWDLVNKYGPLLGYFPKASKSWLTVKPDHLDSARKMFNGTGINITDHGRKHLGAVIGSVRYKEEYMQEKVEEWVSSVRRLTLIAKTQPQAAYSCYVKGFSHKFTYFMRTIPDISLLLKPLDDTVDEFIKVLFNNYDFSAVERKLWSLPTRMGGMGLVIPSKIADEQYRNSRKINEQLTTKVRNQETIFEDIESNVRKAKKEAKDQKDLKNDELLAEVTSQLGSDEKAKALEAIQEKGASSWLNALPIKSQGYALDKQSFRDAIFTRYGIPLSKLPSHCVCGNTYSVEHALNCKKGGFVSSRHNEVQRITADFLKEICIDVEVEPLLQEVTGERFKAKTAKIEKDARLDIAARGFWMRGQKVFCDVRVFNPLTKCHRSKPLAKIHEINENEKKVKYGARVLEIEHGSFTPLVFSCFGGMSRECSYFYKRLSEKLAEKRNISISEATCFIRTKINFSLVKSLVLCIRGSRSLRSEASSIADTDIVLANTISAANE